MLLFSPKAKRVIDYAVWTLPDDRKRRAWQSWAISHHIVRQAGDPTNDGRAPMPPDIAQIVLAALDRMATTLRRRQWPLIRADTCGSGNAGTSR
jgi:hypothetical protein